MMKSNNMLMALFSLLVAAQSLACDMSAFVQSEFSDRCQRLINYCEKAYITLSTDFPDIDKRLSELSNDWIDFYLSHGKKEVQPPNMAFIPAEIWEKNMQNLGNRFSTFIRKNITTLDYENILLQISILKNEEQLTKLHNCFKTSNLCENSISEIEDLNLWLDSRFIAPASLVYAYVENLPELVEKLNLEVEEYRESIKRMTKLTQEASVEVKQSFFDNLNRSIEKSLKDWEELCFYR